jgi:uncharacterized protein YqeY
MALIDDINAQFKAALKAREQTTVDCLRLLRTAITVRQKAHPDPITDDDVRQVISTLIKQRREAVDIYLQAGEQVRADKEKAEIEVLAGFLPPPLTEADLAALIDRVIADEGAVSPKDMGRVMKAVMAQVTGRADGKVVNQLVKARLTGSG